MGQNAPLGQQRAPQPDTFWRRRVIALAIGIAILGLLAWAVNGVVGGSGPTRPAADVGHAAGPAAPSADPGTALFTVPSSPSASAAATGSARAHPAASSHSGVPKHGGAPKHGAAPKPGASPTHKTVTTAHAGNACPTSDVVITLIAAQYSYGSGAVPEFDVSVVSTASRTCTFDVGAKHVRLVIKSGPARVWGSSDCTAGAGSQVTKLARGVPYMLHISWNRKTSVPRCRLAATVARPGTYTATVWSGQLNSNTLVFVLRGKGIAEP